MKRTMKAMNQTVHLGERTLIMGILNVTPDSFSDGGHHNGLARAVLHAEQMIADGADIIDIGGESTRPGFLPVSEAEELARVIPVVEALASKGYLMSVDTTKPAVARAALTKGAQIINDIWGFQSDPDMARVAAEFQTMSIVMHNHHTTDYTIDIIEHLKRFFEQSIAIAMAAGLAEDKLVLDPGIGFAKTEEHNLQILARLSELNSFGLPILLGTSRKSTIGKVLNLPVDQRVEGTLATTALGIAAGVDIVRVHDIKENLRTAKVCDAIIRGDRSWMS